MLSEIYLLSNETILKYDYIKLIAWKLLVKNIENQDVYDLICYKRYALWINMLSC